MKYLFKSRWFFFLLGLSVGTLISIFVFNEIFKPHSTTSASFYETKPAKIEKPISVNKPNKKQKKKKLKPVKNNIVVDSNVAVSQVDTIDKDSSLIIQSTINGSLDLPTNPNDIVVVKDELLFSKRIIPMGDATGFLCDESHELDSLLVDNITTIANEGIEVEFWKSPVNYKGYKLSKRKLILFGIMEIDSLHLEFQNDKSLLLSYKNQLYELKCRQDFLPLNIRK